MCSVLSLIRDNEQRAVSLEFMLR